jgi:hypothetical protein
LKRRKALCKKDLEVGVLDFIKYIPRYRAGVKDISNFEEFNPAAWSGKTL